MLYLACGCALWAKLVLRPCCGSSCAVAITVTVAVFLRLELYAIEQDGEILDFLLVAHALQVVEEALVDLALTHDIDGEVDIAVDDRGVGNHAEGHGVEHDVVVAAAQLADERLELAREQQLCGVGRDGAYAYHVEVLAQVGLGDDVVEIGDVVGEVGCHAHAVGPQAEVL